LATPFENALQAMAEMGFFAVALPFLLIFTIVYGVLERTKVFGDKRHDINATVALVIALIVVSASWAVGVLTNFLPYVGIISVVIISALMLIALLYGNLDNLIGEKGDAWVKRGGVVIIAAALLIVLLYVLKIDFVNLATIIGRYFGLNANDFALVAGFILLFAIIVWIAKPAEQKKAKEE